MRIMEIKKETIVLVNNILCIGSHSWCWFLTEKKELTAHLAVDLLTKWITGMRSSIFSAFTHKEIRSRLQRSIN